MGGVDFCHTSVLSAIVHHLQANRLNTAVYQNMAILPFVLMNFFLL